MIRFEHRKAGVYVVDVGALRSLRLGSPDAPQQALIRKDDLDQVLMGYVRFAALGLAYTTKPRRMLQVGLGGGVFARMMRGLAPEASIDAVEVEPVVVDVARRFFGLDELFGAHLRVHVEDAAAFVKRTRRQFDLVFLDAYDAGGAVEHLSKEAFFDAVRRRLAPGGVVIANVAAGSVEERRFVARFCASFAACDVYRVPDEANLVLFGRERALPERTLQRRVRDLARKTGLGASLEMMLSCRARMG